jgi:hypothetical protein
MSDEKPIFTPEQIAPRDYEFTEDERPFLAQLRSSIVLAKERVHDLNVQLEQVQVELRGLKAQYAGALGITAKRCKMSSAEISQDLSKLVRK